MPKRMYRQRDGDKLVCDSCKANAFGAKEWAVAYASRVLPPHLVEEFERRESEALASLVRMVTLQTTAHDAGDGQTSFHCPFCGSGAVTGGPDGTVKCDFCHQSFTVQVQPEFKAMPQTIDGQPFNIPGMPGGGPDAGGAPVADAAAQGDVQVGQPGEPPDLPVDPTKAAPPEPKKAPTKAPPVAARLLVQGIALPYDKGLQHLALRYADNRDAVLNQVRAENGAA
jgi:hypothetical protein